ncbi:MAG: hypothetical protein Q9227_006701 [Pyrenula ochraceoflavens]
MAPAQQISFGQVIEYIQASYTLPPNEQTPFPYASEPRRSPNKRSSKYQHGPTPVTQSKPPVYFTIDDTLLYNAFHADFGPLHIGHLYRFAVQFHEILGDPANAERAVVFWSRTDSQSRANAACLVACYMVLIQSWPPHLALAPIAQADPPYMPFRDAGYSQADFVLNIQDVVYGVWKAKEEGLCGLKEFNLEEYERYERVDMGDFNWITPSFLAFASPQQPPVAPVPRESPLYATFPQCIPDIASNSKLTQPFKNVLAHFVERDVGLVVRLNSELYCPTFFTALGIEHIDMIFEDGTCPALPVVRKFFKLAHEMINIKHRGIAVHCKAGLGRTGCFIGAYLIYRHGFTANEIIAFMRFMRPGMVVGPQQHWLHLNQGTFREWWFEDQVKAKLNVLPSTPTKRPTSSKTRLVSNNQTSTPPNGSQRPSRSALGEIAVNESNPTPASAYCQDENLPAPTPGQPRKGHRSESRQNQYARSSSAGHALARLSNNDSARPGTEIVSMRAHRQSQSGNESEEEYTLRMLAHRRSQSRSPNGKKRAVSYTTTTTTTTHYEPGIWEDGMALDEVRPATSQIVELGKGNEGVENQIWEDLARDAAEAKTPRATGGSGSGTLGVMKQRRAVTDKDSPGRRRSGGEEKGRVRKTSGRVGSAAGGPIGVTGRGR